MTAAHQCAPADGLASLRSGKPDSSGELDKIKAPTLIVSGDWDELCPRVDQEALAAAIADSRLVVYPGTGHGLHWEEPERFASDLVAFVQTVAI